MQIIITHGRLARARVLRFGGLQVGLAFAALLASLALLFSGLYHVVLPQAVGDGWPVVGAMAQPLLGNDAARRDRYLRENLDAMARKVGEMQAKLIQLEAVGDRVSGLAGLALPAAGAPLPPAAADAQAPAGWRRGRGRTAGDDRDLLPRRAGRPAAQGGPFVPAQRPSMAQLDAMIASLDQRADIGADIFTAVESRLFEKRLRSLMVPNSRPIDGPTGSGFGFRADPFSGRAALHTGLDFPADTGTPIVASAGGLVLAAEFHPQYGQLVELDHGNGLVTRYAHASKLLVRAGDIVKRGQTIALSGSSGRSTGPHLHFEVMVEGVLQDPAKFLGGAPAPALAGRDAAAGR